MLAYWREMDLFLVDTGYAKYLNGAGNEKVSRFFCACLEKGTKSIKSNK